MQDELHGGSGVVVGGLRLLSYLMFAVVEWCVVWLSGVVGSVVDWCVLWLSGVWCG